MYRQKDYESAFADFKKNNAIEVAKYQSPNSDELILGYLVQTQRLPTQTTVHIAIQELAGKGLLVATSKNIATVRAMARKGLDEALANAETTPITRDEELYAASLSFAELQRLYWGEDLEAIDYFSARYRKLARERGYQIPARPVVEEEAGADDGVELTADEYHKIPASELRRKMQNPAFKMQIFKLMKAGKI